MAKRKSMKRGIQRVDVDLYGDEFMEIVERYGDEAMFAAGSIVLRSAEGKAARRTGMLAKSGYVATKTTSTYVKRRGWRKEKKAPAGGAVIGFTAPHAHLIESGRRASGKITPRKRNGKQALSINGAVRASSRFTRMSSRPFLGPALEDAATDMVQELVNVLNRRLQSEGRK